MRLIDRTGAEAPPPFTGHVQVESLAEPWMGPAPAVAMQDTAGRHPSMPGFFSPSTRELTTPSPVANLKQSKTKPWLGLEPWTGELYRSATTPQVGKGPAWVQGLGMHALQGAREELHLDSTASSRDPRLRVLVSGLTSS